MIQNEINNILEQNNILYYEPKEDTNTGGLTAYIGKTQTGEKIIIDFEKSSHLLIGGASGSGKSTLIHCILKSLLNKYKDIFLLLVDIKRVEFLNYRSNSQVIATATNSKDTFSYLERIVNVMFNRYRILEKKQVKTIKEYNLICNDKDKMQHIFILIDETGDILLDNKAIKIPLQRILQLGRAVGIHCILATQSPNCKTIPTDLKINITTRIALQVPTTSNSKIILDTKGAEQLSKSGEAIIRSGNIQQNFQVAFVND